MPRVRKTWVKKNAITRDANVVRDNPSEWFLLDDGSAAPSGQSNWGAIGGNITDQQDLQDELTGITGSISDLESTQAALQAAQGQNSDDIATLTSEIAEIATMVPGLIRNFIRC